MLTLGAGLFAAGALIFTAAEFNLSRRRFLNERFSAIANQIGDDQAAVRLAGLQAMARLADDWQANQQGCIDVLCAYLRMDRRLGPRDDGGAAPERSAGASPQPRRTNMPIIVRVRRTLWPDPAAEETAAREQANKDERDKAQRADLEEQQVRATVIRLIAEHLRKPPGWQRRYFDFTGAVFDVGDFDEVEFKAEMVRFDDAQFRDRFSFEKARFSGKHTRFQNAHFSGTSFKDAKFSGTTAAFDEATFSNFVTFEGAEFPRSEKFDKSEVWFTGAKFPGTVSFEGAKFQGRDVNFWEAKFSGTVSFKRAKFSGKVSFKNAVFSGMVSFEEAPFSKGNVWFSHAKFSSGRVDFTHAEFSGATVDFTHAEFSGATVDLQLPARWTSPPLFRHWDGPPPRGLLLPS